MKTLLLIEHDGSAEDLHERLCRNIHEGHAPSGWKLGDTVKDIDVLPLDTIRGALEVKLAGCEIEDAQDEFDALIRMRDG